MDWTWILPTIAIGAAALAALMALRKKRDLWLRRKRAERAEREAGRCANCGYSLEGLEIPRCPECGTLPGFRKPLDELGLTDEEIREGFARRRRERGHQQPDSEDQS
jgi:hypothetical protein